MKNNAIGWFEVPVSNMDRAIKFYETILDISLSRNTMGDFDMAWFPYKEDAPGAAGSLVHHKEYKPSTEGTLVYFSSQTGDLNDELGRVEAAGGQVLLSKKIITEEYGYMALIMDSEGNKVALHSMK